jgi:predicted ArsR family transcriptional regulator
MVMFKLKGGDMEQIANDYDALVTALALALTAPSDEKAMEVAAQAELVARSLTPEDVTRAKAEALAMAALLICGVDPEEEA